MRWFGLPGLLVAGLLLPGVAAAERQLRIVTTFLPAYCAAANVGGKAAQVENLLPGTVNLHDYQLTPGDVRKLSSADVIVINGLGMEGFLDRALANSGPGAAEKIVRLSDGLDRQLVRDHQNSPNPHIWLDPRLFMQGVSNVQHALETRDPANALAYQENARKFLERLGALDAEIAKAVEPVKAIPFVTYHNAFPYFVRRYGLTLAGVVERVPEVTPSPKEMSQLLQEIRTRKAKALFTEPAARTRLAEQIARDAAIRLAELDPVETGVIDPRSYERAMRRNAEVLRKTLGE
jgi:zinc transport system substrate-binding protein